MRTQAEVEAIVRFRRRRTMSTIAAIQANTISAPISVQSHAIDSLLPSERLAGL